MAKKDQQKRDLAIRASLLYYEENKSQDEIASLLGISRSYISQLLSYARDTDIVKIEVLVDEFGLRMIRKEVEWCSRWPSLKQAFIMKSDNAKFTERQIGKFAAPYVTELIKNADVIGIGLGTAVMGLLENLSLEELNNGAEKQVIQIMGGLSSEIISGAHPNELVSVLSTKLNSEYHYLNCPAGVENEVLRDALVREPSIRKVIDKWDEADLAIMGIGPADERSTLLKAFSPKMKKIVRESDACGEININFFDANGQYIPLLEDNRIAMGLDQIQKVKTKVIIGYGEHKVRPILAALRAGLVDILITDSLTIDQIEKIQNIT